MEEGPDPHVRFLLLQLWRLQAHELPELREHLLPEPPATRAGHGGPLVLGAGRGQDDRRVTGKTLLLIGKWKGK